MRSPVVPDVVQTLLRAVEARDLETVHAAFTPDAAIADEGEVVHGPAGVERWATRAMGYGLAFVVDAVSSAPDETDDDTVVTTTTTGDFAGSPLVFRWYFAFDEDRISSLRIEI
ncbi:nuclear transport factor 2 family protein [Patulibacter americanus]|uniref:nuclear transport factor 2 family protein n=1 Tax=Patulibacter americanus TaxID=588672 RepID=UPI0003B2E705|nr:nuclear transport factor 2 family protein [Patulibacter americanus]